MITNFVYNDIVLYAKGWYEHSDNILDDLGYLFSKIYAWTPKKESEISRFMLITIDTLYEQLNLRFKTTSYGRYNNSFSSFYGAIDNKMKIYDISFDMAIIYWSISILQLLTIKEIKLNPPDTFNKKSKFRLGRLFGKYPISMTYKHMNDIVNKHFNN